MSWPTLWQGKWILLVLAVATAAAWFFGPWWLVTPPAALLAFTLWFFRDPPRTVPSGPGLIVSPADGRITDIVEIEESELVNRRARRIGIFLSVFDVHVNRAPADCRVVYTAEFEGTYHDARSPAASTHNTARTWGFECRDGVLLIVRQITGAIARRIVPWAHLDQRLARGERFGMIRFGSRTEICLPLEAEVVVRVGDHVKGGSTVIARLAPSGETAPSSGHPSAVQ
jgi:phosphatidylserine decarboxylase